jgi:hypothetical protein
MNMKHILLSIAVLFLAGVCGMPASETPFPTETPIPKFTPVCISEKPTKTDVERALSFTGNTFDTAEWSRSYTVNDQNRVAVTWLNNTQGALAYLEALIFPCGYEEPDIDNYFSGENWKIIFQYYESYKLINSCKGDDGLRLYQFAAQAQGIAYEIRYWVRNDTNNRLISLMLTFPASNPMLMDSYARRIFPTLVSCK